MRHDRNYGKGQRRNHPQPSRQAVKPVDQIEGIDCGQDPKCNREGLQPRGEKGGNTDHCRDHECEGNLAQQFGPRRHVIMSSSKPSAHTAKAPNNSQPGTPRNHPTLAKAPTTATPPSSGAASLCHRSLAGPATHSNWRATRLEKGIAAATKNSATTGLSSSGLTKLKLPYRSGRPGPRGTSDRVALRTRIFYRSRED
jgi:hypothetical protein